jgi:hypothetical protein
MDDCIHNEKALKWCLALNPQPQRCEVLLQDLSRCYAKLLL